jgi:hypothetical protein
MPDKTRKRVERDVASFLDGNRVGCTGLAVEVKHRRSLPAWLLAALEQAQGHVEDGETGIAVLHQHRQRIADSLVVLRLEDFKAPLGLSRAAHVRPPSPNDLERSTRSRDSR